MFRRNVNFLKVHSGAGQFSREVFVDSFDISNREVAAANARLVGHKKQKKTRIHQSAQCLSCARIQDHVFDLGKVILVFDDCSVSIEKNGAFAWAGVRLCRALTHLVILGTLPGARNLWPQYEIDLTAAV